MIKLTQEHLEALLDKFGGEHNPPSIYLEVSWQDKECLSWVWTESNVNVFYYTKKVNFERDMIWRISYMKWLEFDTIYSRS